MPRKKPKEYSLNLKVTIVRQLDEGATVAQLGTLHDIPSSTISMWKRNKEKILADHKKSEKSKSLQPTLIHWVKDMKSTLKECIPEADNKEFQRSEHPSAGRMATAMHEESLSSRGNSVPSLPPDSPGSSVSSRMQDEYDELLKYAVVVPTIDATNLPNLIHDSKGSFMQDIMGQMRQQQQQQQARSAHKDQHTPRQGSEHDDDGSTTVGEDEDSTDQSDSASHARSTPSSTEVRNTKFYNAVHAREVDKFMAAQKFPHPMISETDSITELKKRQQLEGEEGLAEDQLSSLAGSEMGESPSHLMAGFSPGIDPDITRMETLMEQWLGDLKRNVLAEFSHSRIRQMEGSRQNFQKEREKHGREMTSLQNELESMKELLHTYEQSIERKDDVITNLTRAMQKQKDKFDMLKTFCEWKIKHNDAKREGFAGNLAAKHYERSLQQKAWDGWHSLIEARWKQRVEKACQAKAQEVCMQLTNDYESKITSLNDALNTARVEVSKLHAERDRYEETMKKAFMRGVCALNMEAMAMFHEAEDGTPVENGMPTNMHPEGSASGVHPVHFLADQVPLPDHLGAPVSIPQEPMFTSEPPGAPAPRVVSAPSAKVSQQSSGMSSKTGAKPKPTKTIKAKITARTDSGRGSGILSSASGSFAPPMSSVMVERHQPVTKQTIGHATAMKYPKSGIGSAQHTQSSIIQRKVSGQAGNVGHAGSVQLVNTNIQTVKVVE